MKYFTAIYTFIFLNFFLVVALIFYGNQSRIIQEENNQIKENIENQYTQFKINQVEYSLHNNYEYLKKLQKLYYDDVESTKPINNRLSFKNFHNKNISNVFNASSK